MRLGPQRCKPPGPDSLGLNCHFGVRVCRGGSSCVLTTLFYWTHCQVLLGEDISGGEGEEVSSKCESEAWEVAGGGTGLQ